MDKNDQTVVSSWDIVVAGTLLTRLTLPHAPTSAFRHQARSVWAFPVIGLGIGLMMVLTGALAWALGLPASLAAGMMLGVAIISTGAMHEDGLADCADGFWGGYTPTRRLDIMKDSQIGTYGVLALVLTIGLKWMALTSIIAVGWGGVIAAAVLSRAMMPGVMISLAHARTDGLAHGVGRPSSRSVQISSALALVISIICVGWAAFALIVTGLSIAFGWRWIAKAKINGQTGDVLGATQCLSETAMLIALAAMLPMV